MQNSFCKSLSNAVSFRIPGDKNILTFNPCCLYNEYLPFHPIHFKRTKKMFDEATTFLHGCSKCELKEKTHNQSLRLVTNREIPDGIDNEIYKLEIVLDTTCNAACIQCGSDQSSLWRKEEAGLKKIVHIQPEQQIDDKIAQIKQAIDINKVKSFHFWGGEPLLTDTHLKFLNEKAYDELWKTLKSEVLFFTGSVGDVEHVYLDSIEDLIKVLHVPLLIGQPEFKLEGVLLKHKFNEEDIFQLNYIHSISVQKLKMDEIINNNKLTLFEEQRESIQKEKEERYRNDKDVVEVIDAIFGKQREDESNELPF
jgi:hypothetical protein